MDSIYTHKKKEKLAHKISKIKNKKKLVKIFEIIQEEKKEITENNNGMFTYFHDLSTKAYIKIVAYINKLHKKSIDYIDSITSDDTMSDKKEYKPYSTDDFPSQNGLSPKLKYSNKEKNLIKRRHYDKSINSNNTNNNIIYCDFDVTATMTDTYSENKSKDAN